MTTASSYDVKCETMSVSYLLINYSQVDYKIWGIMEEQAGWAHVTERRLFC